MAILPAAGANVVAFPRRPLGEVGDLRFRALLGDEAWLRLPEPVRARFGRHVGGCRTILYAGEIVECRMSAAGRALANVLRIIGAPLPLGDDAGVPAAVSVTEDPASGGQLWTRIYGRRRGFPQAIHSAKRFCGPTGLEEYIGCGFGVALTVEADEQALHFLSDHYFFGLGGLRLRLPRWLAPGRMRVSHIECGHGAFAFVLALDHPWLGELIRQTIMFEDPPDGR